MSLRLVIDLQGAQAASRNRGIGRYSLQFAQALARNGSGHEILIALNAAFADTIEPIRAAFEGLLPQEQIVVWEVPDPVAGVDPDNTQRRLVAERVREAFLASLKPDWVVVTSLFESHGFGGDAVTSIGRQLRLRTAVVHYDLIPLIHRDIYLSDPIVERWFFEKIDHLRRADLLLSISESSGREAVEYLGFDPASVVPIGTDCDERFRPVPLTEQTWARFRTKYGIEKPFVMYTGGIDHRKNIDGLIRAYAALPHSLREAHQLVVVCAVQAAVRDHLQSLARKAGLGRDELVLTDFVPEEDLLALYNACTLFVFPSWHEGFGLPALEAMRCGKAVLAANTSSLPEVVGRNDALFDPFDEHAMAALIERALTDEDWRRALERHSLTYSQRFSWDATAQKALAALNAPARPVSTHAATGLGTRRPRLAYVSPLPPEKSGIADYSAELIPELARWYEVEVVVAQPEVSDACIRANCAIRTVEEFRTRAASYDRVLYHFGNSPVHEHMFALLEEIPGVVVLHDFSLSDIQAHREMRGQAPHAWARALLESHGYRAVRERFTATDTAKVVARYPANLPVLQMALGIIVHSAFSQALARQWYGDAAATDWAIIPPRNAPHRCAEQYFQTIEGCYRRAEASLPGLLTSLAHQSPPQKAWLRLAASLARDFPPTPRRRQLLVDVSELVQRDAKSGIQRVTRSILWEWLENPPAGFQVEPVYATADVPGYRYARRWTSRFLGISDDWAEDAPAEAWAGDVFVGLDLQHQVISAQQTFLQSWRNRGVKVWFVVYDLLPILLPQVFLKGAQAMHQRWLETVSSFDGVACISRAVADEMTDWLSSSGPKRERPLAIGWFHLGADVKHSVPTTGLPADAEQVLTQLHRRPSFLTVGTIEPRKGHAQTLAAFEQLWAEGTDVNLVIVGKQGWMVETLVDKLRTHPERGKRLFWLEGISDEYLEKVYAASSCLIAASYGEGFGLPLIEAAQHKLPIIARDIPVFREVAGEHAFFFANHKDPNVIAEAVRTWLDLHRAGAAPASQALSWLTWQQSAQWLFEIITGKREPYQKLYFN